MQKSQPLFQINKLNRVKREEKGKTFRGKWKQLFSLHNALLFFRVSRIAFYLRVSISPALDPNLNRYSFVFFLYTNGMTVICIRHVSYERFLLSESASGDEIFDIRSLCGIRPKILYIMGKV